MSIAWTGHVLAVEPRSFDERWREYLGYVLRIDGRMDGTGREFSVALGKAAHAKHGFRRDDVVKARGAVPVSEPRLGGSA